MKEYIKILEDRLSLGVGANIIIKDILKEKHGDLGVLYNTAEDLTMEVWNIAGGTEDIYYDCRHISIELYQKAATFNYTTKQFN